MFTVVSSVPSRMPNRGFLKRRMEEVHGNLEFRTHLEPSKRCCCFQGTAAKSLQSCPTQCDPTDGSPPGSPIPGILQARTLEWVAISFSSILAWKTPWAEEPHRPQSHRLGHDCGTKHTHIQYYIVYMYRNFFIHSSVNDHLGAFTAKLL